jgi:hypothetical protein
VAVQSSLQGFLHICLLQIATCESCVLLLSIVYCVPLCTRVPAHGPRTTHSGTINEQRQCRAYTTQISKCTSSLGTASAQHGFIRCQHLWRCCSIPYRPSHPRLEWTEAPGPTCCLLVAPRAAAANKWFKGGFASPTRASPAT